ncbi:hypothetical protein OUZ56_012045 [Daphnia magna]|uniref:Uncharacterized protein n=1 Tax=Daphnia magna TaxID=35525 RepID=A0ABQ9Z271_9CRUS|nr:hypothetical protein OUZ56_012045 [Daphnia magna]
MKFCTYPLKHNTFVSIDKPYDYFNAAITKGFFIECGALDGEHLSNTLYMERFLSWSGLLIEAGQQAFSELTIKNRKAFSLPVCLSPLPYPTQFLML